MKSKWKKLEFEAQLRLILQEEIQELTEMDIKTSWAILEKRIQIWEQKNAQQQSIPDHHQDNNVLGNKGK